MAKSGAHHSLIAQNATLVRRNKDEEPTLVSNIGYIIFDNQNWTASACSGIGDLALLRKTIWDGTPDSLDLILLAQPFQTTIEKRRVLESLKSHRYLNDKRTIYFASGAILDVSTLFQNPLSIDFARLVSFQILPHTETTDFMQWVCRAKR